VLFFTNYISMSVQNYSTTFRNFWYYDITEYIFRKREIALASSNSKITLNLIPSSSLGVVQSTMWTGVSFFTVLPLFVLPTIVTLKSPSERVPKMDFTGNTYFFFVCMVRNSWSLPVSSLISKDHDVKHLFHLQLWMKCSYLLERPWT